MLRFTRWFAAGARTGLAVLAACAVLSLVASAALADGDMGEQGGGTSITGPIGNLPGTSGFIGDWTVGAVTVHVTAATHIDQENGAVAVGAVVRVDGALQPDKSINAMSIEVQEAGQGGTEVEFVGTVKNLPGTADFTGDWTVDAVTVHVTSTTEIDQSKGAVAVGVMVQVEGTKQTDGSVDAAEIKVLPATAPTGCGNQVVAVLKLVPTADAPPEAEGQVVTRHFVFPDATVREDLKVMVEDLKPQTAYDVTIDGVAAGTIMTDEEGEGHLFLSTASIPGAEPLPPALQPVTGLKKVTVTDPSAVVIFNGDFANARVNCGQEEGQEFTSIAPLKNASGTVVGVASAAMRGSDQMLFVAGFGFTPGATVHIVVDGTDLGAFTIGEEGELRAKFSNNPEDDQRQLPAALLPVSSLLHIEIQDTGGNVLASGDFTVVNAEASKAMGATRRRVGGGHH